MLSVVAVYGIIIRSTFDHSLAERLYSDLLDAGVETLFDTE